jgi:ATP-dependent Clp protease ATP-binding subunit ClpC
MAIRVRFPEPIPAALSDRARKAFQLAHQEAQRLHHPAVGLDHLLVGLAKETQSPAAALLARLGYDLPWLRSRVEAANPPGDGGVVYGGSLPYAADLETFLRTVLDAAASAGVRSLTPVYLLAALVRDSTGSVPRILGQKRLSFWRLRRRFA